MSVPPVEFTVLVNKLLDETISESEHVQLMDQLRGNPKAIKEYLFLIGVHTSLRELEEKTEDEVFRSAEPARWKGGRSPVSHRRRTIFPHWKILVTPVLAGVFLIVLFASNWNRVVEKREVADDDSVVAQVKNAPAAGMPDSVSPAAALAKRSPVRLTQAAQVELFFERTPEIGAEIELGREFSLSKGQMELTFDNGATAVMQAPAMFVVTGPMRIEMRMGLCSVYAPPSAAGFEVITPQGRIVDLGTRFSVLAKEVGVSDIQVVEGAVQYHSTSTEAASETGTMLLEGEAIRIPDAADDSEVIPFNRDEYRSQFPDRVVSYTAEPDPRGKGVRDLTSVTVQRGGTVQVYPVDDLIGVELLHFSASTKLNSFCSADPHPKRPDLLLSESVALTEGITNFDRPEPFQPASDYREFRKRHGLAVKFTRPVINRPGPDVVLFELQSAAYPPAGDAIYISPIESGEGLKTHHLTQFDITMHSSNALEVAPVMTHLLNRSPTSLEELLNSEIKRSSLLHVPFYALAVGIDLSDLGYAENAAVPGLFIEDGDDDDFVAIDIVFIGGLPESSDLFMENEKSPVP